MATTIEQFGSEYEDCNKISADRVNAYVEAYLDEGQPQNLIVDSSWGTSTVDLTDAVKAAETVTHLYLTPTDNPDTLAFDREDGRVDCIHGDRLSRIISMTKLKDVDQDTEIADGDVYMYDSVSKTFKPYDLKAFINTTNNRLDALESQVAGLTTAINNLTETVNNILEQIARPEGVPENTRIAYGNINILSDYTNSDNRTNGIFTHNPANLIANDEYFS